MFSSLLYLKYTHKTDLVLHQNFISLHSIDFSLSLNARTPSVRCSRLSAGIIHFRAERARSLCRFWEWHNFGPRLELLVSGTIKKESLVLTSTFPALRERAHSQREKSSQRLSYFPLSTSKSLYTCVCAGAHTSGDGASTPGWERAPGSLFKSHSTDNNEAMKTSAYLNENLSTKFITPRLAPFFILSSLFSVSIFFQRREKRPDQLHIILATHDAVSER